METLRKLARQAQMDASQATWPADEALPAGLGQRLDGHGSPAYVASETPDIFSEKFQGVLL
jgi:hypothetical protein